MLTDIAGPILQGLLEFRHEPASVSAVDGAMAAFNLPLE